MVSRTFHSPLNSPYASTVTSAPSLRSVSPLTLIALIVDKSERVVSVSTQWIVLILALKGWVSLLAAAADNRLGDFLNFLSVPLLAPINHFIPSQSDVFEVNVAIAIGMYGVLGWVVARLLHAWKQYELDLVYSERM